MRWILFTLLLITTVHANAQVPFDTSNVPELQEIKRLEYGGRMMWGLTSVPEMCGQVQNDVVITAYSDRGAQTYSQTAPLDTISIYNWPAAPSTGWVREIDYDGIDPKEYVNQNGEILRCSGTSSFPMEKVDSLACISIGIHTRYSCDVDGNGLSDIVLYPKDETQNYADVILSGAEFGIGCNRVMSLPRKPGNNGLVHTTTWVRFYRDFDGQLRMLINRTPVNPQVGGVYLYKVLVNRIGLEWNAEYVATDSIVRNVDVGLSRSILYPEEIVRDDIARHHYTVQSWTRGYRYGRDVLNEPVVSIYLIDGGHLVETEAVVGEVSSVYSHGNQFDSGSPLITLSYSDYWKYFCRITELSKPICKFQWIISAPYRTFINDQNGDGKRDFLIATDHMSGQLRLYDMNSSTTSVVQENNSLEWVALIGEQLHVTTTQPCQLFYRITDMLGKSIFAASVLVDAQPTTIDLSSTLSLLTKGKYFVSVQCSSRQRTFMIFR